MTKNEYFLDTTFAVALSLPTDEYHERALVLSNRIESSPSRLVTTRAVILEIGNALAKLRVRQETIELLESLEADPIVEIVPLSESLYYRAFKLYSSRPDKEWGLIDCISFVVMQDYGLADALTADVHFQQAGFKALMKEAAQ